MKGNPSDRDCPGCKATYPEMVFVAAGPEALCYRCRQTKRAKGDRRRYHERHDARKAQYGSGASAWDQRPMLAAGVA